MDFRLLFGNTWIFMSKEEFSFFTKENCAGLFVRRWDIFLPK